MPRYLKYRVAAILFLLLPLGISNLYSQGSKPSAQIKVRTWVVSLNVVVTDKGHNPVAGLTKEDFTVIDNGKRQDIAFFSLIQNQAQTAAQPLPPDTYTNDWSKLGEPPSVTVLLFDALNTDSEVRAYDMEEIRTFLRHLRPQDRIGVYVLREASSPSGGLGLDFEVLHDFTQDATDLLSAIQRYDARKTASPAKTVARDGTENPALDRFLQGKENGAPNPPRLGPQGQVWHGGGFDPHAEAHFQTTTQAFQAIRRHLDGVPGRKALVYLTQSLHAPFPVDPLRSIPSAYTANFDFIQRQFNDSGIAIYPVSAGGVESSGTGFIDNPGPGFGVSTSLPEVPMHLDMRRLAERTGGRPFIMRNDLDTGIEQALNDARLSYSIGYYLDHARPGQFHKIKVMVDREDVTVLSRDGYNGPSTPISSVSASSISTSSALVRRIAESPLDSSVVPFTVAVKKAEGRCRSPSRPRLRTIHVRW